MRYVRRQGWIQCIGGVRVNWCVDRGARGLNFLEGAGDEKGGHEARQHDAVERAGAA